MQKILVVGAGFAGAVHARLLANAGYDVHIIDSRPHIAGNAFDRIDANGIRVHVYGPHLFHTKNKEIINWLSNFTTFVPYEHKVRALLDGGSYVPLPINIDTVNAVFGSNFENENEVTDYLRNISEKIDETKDAASYLYSNIGRKLTDTFFRPYTKKMWNLDLEEMSDSVVKRIPIRFNRTDTYFADDEIQAMPQDGYTEIFEKIFDHKNIKVSLETPFAKEMLSNYDFCFNSMPIDEYFNFELGELPYRSLRFHHETHDGLPQRDWSVTNFTDSGKFTRETMWHILPNHVHENTGRYTTTKEEPCDYRDNNMERYYPVKTADGRYVALYEKYKILSAQEPNIQFIGRCGTYQYLDMDQVINQSLISAKKWIASRS